MKSCPGLNTLTSYVTNLPSQLDYYKLLHSSCLVQSWLQFFTHLLRHTYVMTFSFWEIRFVLTYILLICYIKKLVELL